MVYVAVVLRDAIVCSCWCCFFFFQAEAGIRDLVRSRGLGDVYKRPRRPGVGLLVIAAAALGACSSETKRSIDDASTTVASSSTTVLADVTTTLAATTTVPVEATTIPVVTDAPTTIPAPKPTDPPATDAPGFGLYDEARPVSYTHPTLPTSDLGSMWVRAASI